MSVPSPCIQVCAMSQATGLCQGCWRTLDEIAAWGTLSDADKLLVWRALRSRKQAALRPPGGSDTNAAGDAAGKPLSDT